MIPPQPKMFCWKILTTTNALQQNICLCSSKSKQFELLSAIKKSLISYIKCLVTQKYIYFITLLGKISYFSKCLLNSVTIRNAYTIIPIGWDFGKLI